jgi:mono/diheme cytochrome c family protein
MAEHRPVDAVDPNNLPEYGLIAQYDDVTSLIGACEQVRDAGYTKWDAHSPFPVHGIDAAVGIRPTRLPLLIFGAGITGTSVAVLMQWWMNAFDYPFLISGKPLWSLPANIPVAFELTVLFAALTAIFATLARNLLPRHHHPLLNNERFARVTDDKFFIAIEAKDGRYEPARTRALLEGTGAVAVESVPDDSKVNASLPKPLVYFLVAAFLAGFMPLGVAARAWFSKSSEPRIHLNPNMDFQDKFKTQTANPLFADGRSMRPDLQDTVAEGWLKADDAFFRGLDADANWVAGFPTQVEVSAATMTRGRDRFDIYCAPCHGTAGYGDGPVARRAAELKQAKWVAPSSLHQDYLRTQPEGKLFNTITHGIRNMPGYGHAMPEADRWAIVMYIRALQRSQLATTSDVPDTERAKLR